MIASAKYSATFYLQCIALISCALKISAAPFMAPAQHSSFIAQDPSTSSSNGPSQQTMDDTSVFSMFGFENNAWWMMPTIRAVQPPHENEQPFSFVNPLAPNGNNPLNGMDGPVSVDKNYRLIMNQPEAYNKVETA
ncbi:hypothetical protein BDF19DRAFT_430213 [Syncephalis fuscata]|nr:hypothetical protein BDF19DRAFT_430213 [Syncephalis fuscata]